MTPEQGETVAQRMNASYVECSSKEMYGVDEVFALAVHTAVSAEEQDWNDRPSPSSKGKAGRGGNSSVAGSSGGGSGRVGGGGGGKKIKKRTCKIL